MAQSANSMQLPETEAIAQQRIALAEEKKVILDHFHEASKACWKQFAVNDCLFKAKQQKYQTLSCLLYTSPSPRDRQKYRMPSSA